MNMHLKDRVSSNSTLIRGSMMVFIGTMISNLGSYIYHLIMGRSLGPVGYGELSSLISLLYIFGVPTTVLHTTIVKFFSSAKAENDKGKAADLYIRVFKALVIGLVIMAVLVIGLSGAIARYLHLDTPVLVILTFGAYVFMTLMTINTGLLQAFQIFLWYSIISGGAIVVKLAFSIPVADFGVTAVMWAALAATLLTYLVSFVPIKEFFSVARSRFQTTKRAVLGYSIPTLLALVGFTSLYSTDVILVKHYLSPTEAGIYASVSVLGKMIYYASFAVVMVLFPVLSEQTAKGRLSYRIIKNGSVFVGGISLLGTIFYYLMPGFISGLLYGTAYASAAPYLGPFGIFISIFSVANVFLYTLLAVGHQSVYLAPLAAAVIQIILIALDHGSIWSVIQANIIAAAVAFAGLLYFLLRYRKEQHA